MSHSKYYAELLTRCALDIRHALDIDAMQSNGSTTDEQREKAVTIVALLHYLAESVVGSTLNGGNMQGRIKRGVGTFQDHHFGKWPNCCPPRSEYEGEEYKHMAKDPDMVFDVEWTGSHWNCKADGYGMLRSRGEDGEYGNGSIFVRDRDGVELVGVEGGTNLSGGLAADPKAEGWTWHQGGRKWHYYRGKRAICGGMLLLVHPSEGYELGSDNSKDNCAACKRKKLAEAANVKLTSTPTTAGATEKEHD